MTLRLTLSSTRWERSQFRRMTSRQLTTTYQRTIVARAAVTSGPGGVDREAPGRPVLNEVGRRASTPYWRTQRVTEGRAARRCIPRIRGLCRGARYTVDGAQSVVLLGSLQRGGKHHRQCTIGSAFGLRGERQMHRRQWHHRQRSPRLCRGGDGTVCCAVRIPTLHQARWPGRSSKI